MKIVFLDVKTIGEDIDLSAYDELGEVVKYSFSSSEEVPARVTDEREYRKLAMEAIEGRISVGTEETVESGIAYIQA